MVTLKDIALRSNLSIKTVSLVINGGGRMAPATRERVLALAKEMDYQPSQAARTLVSRKSHLLGAVFPYTDASFFAHILAGLEYITRQHRYSLLLVNSEVAPEDNTHAWSSLLQHNVDGLVIVPVPLSVASCQGLLERQANRRAFPVVQVMNYEKELGPARVRVDNAGGTEQALEHLTALGHRRIGMITHESDPTVEGDAGATQTRRAAYERFMARRGLPVDPRLREDADVSFVGGEAAAERLFSRPSPPTALFCASDYAALGAIRALRRLGLRVPEDVSVVGFDDVAEASRQALGPLTTVAQPKREVGVAAGQMLLDMLAGAPGREIRLPTELKIRTTTAPPARPA